MSDKMKEWLVWTVYSAGDGTEWLRPADPALLRDRLVPVCGRSRGEALRAAAMMRVEDPEGKTFRALAFQSSRMVREVRCAQSSVGCHEVPLLRAVLTKDPELGSVLVCPAHASDRLRAGLTERALLSPLLPWDDLTELLREPVPVKYERTAEEDSVLFPGGPSCR